MSRLDKFIFNFCFRSLSFCWSKVLRTCSRYIASATLNCLSRTANFAFTRNCPSFVSESVRKFLKYLTTFENELPVTNVALVDRQMRCLPDAADIAECLPDAADIAECSVAALSDVQLLRLQGQLG